MILQIAKYPGVEKFNLSSLKYIHSGAAPLGENLPALIKEKTGITVYQGENRSFLSKV